MGSSRPGGGHCSRRCHSLGGQIEPARAPFARRRGRDRRAEGCPRVRGMDRDPGRTRNADVKAQVTGYLVRQDYKEGSYVSKGQLLFEIDPRPFQAALDQASGQLAQAKAQLAQDEAQVATAEANQLKSQPDVNKYEPLAKAQAASQQDLDNAVQTNLANKAQVQSAQAAIVAARAQIEASQAAVETATINLGFTRVSSPIDGIVGIAQAQWVLWSAPAAEP